MTHSPSIPHLLEVAVQAAEAGGRITLEWFGDRTLHVLTKHDQSPVTIADRSAEITVREIIQKHFPRHSILGEEHGEVIGSEPVQWVIDPIDGTKSFINGVPLYGTMVAVLLEREPVVGVVYIPVLGELYAAACGFGATCNGSAISVSARSSIEESRIMCTDLRRLDRTVADRERLHKLLERAQIVRTWGDCYGHMLVASGRAEVMIDPKMAVWDNAALLPIVTEAGGSFSAWTGARIVDGGNAVSTNGLLHGDVLRALA